MLINTDSPIDGLVLTYDNIQYGKSNWHDGAPIQDIHSNTNSMEDEETTRLRDVEWSVGKDGATYTYAIFDSVELDGTTVTAHLWHNVSILKDLKLGIGDEVTVYKANAIIPQIRENLSKSGTVEIPSTCPVCNDRLKSKRKMIQKFLSVRIHTAKQKRFQS